MGTLESIHSQLLHLGGAGSHIPTTVPCFEENKVTRLLPCVLACSHEHSEFSSHNSVPGPCSSGGWTEPRLRESKVRTDKEYVSSFSLCSRPRTPLTASSCCFCEFLAMMVSAQKWELNEAFSHQWSFGQVFVTAVRTELLLCGRKICTRGEAWTLSCLSAYQHTKYWQSKSDLDSNHMQKGVWHLKIVRKVLLLLCFSDVLLSLSELPPPLLLQCVPSRLIIVLFSAKVPSLLF